MPTLTLKPGQPFNLDATLSCGQAFRWERDHDGWWYGVVRTKVLKIRQDGRRLTYGGVSAPFIRHYFSLDVDLEAVLASIDTDPFIHECIRKNRGLRLVRQQPWECTVSYICSTNSNIPAIRRRIESIAGRFGRPVIFEGRDYHLFPGPGPIFRGGSDALAECRLGYREPYVFGTSGTATEEKGWDRTIRTLPCEEARQALMKFSGVGPKAADCILLFAFQRYEAFPVDVWIRRIMQQHYIGELNSVSPLSIREYDLIRRFARDHFGEYCGYAQEYLYAAREDKKSKTSELLSTRPASF
jgi:N-glycosylase/DNA lyase